MTARRWIISTAGFGFFIACVFWLDQAVVEWLQRLSGLPFLRGILKGLGKGGVQGAVFLMILFDGWRTRREECIRSGAIGLIGLVGTGLVVRILKIVVGRARPNLLLGSLAFFNGPSVSYEYNSFPSGDAASAFFIAHFLSGWKPKLAPFIYILAGMIAVNRVIDRAHFPSDILIGALTGIAMASYALSRFRQADFSGLMRKKE